MTYQVFQTFAIFFQTSYEAEMTLVPHHFSLPVIVFPLALSFLNTGNNQTAPMLIQHYQSNEAGNEEEVLSEFTRSRSIVLPLVSSCLTRNQGNLEQEIPGGSTYPNNEQKSL